MSEDKKENFNKSSIFRYIFAGFLIILAVGIIFFVCRNIYFSRLEKPVDNIIHEENQEEDSVEVTQVDFYSEVNRIAIKKTKSLNFDINNVKINDEYNNLKFSFILDKDYLSSFDLKNYDFKNDIYNGFSISNTENGLTVLSVSENDIYGFKLGDDTEYYYIIGGEPGEIYDNIVVLDAGHGGEDPGCEGFGYNEKEICLDIALKAEKYLNEEGYVKAYLTRKDDRFIKLGDRVKFAENLGDILVSIHINYNEDYPDVSGTEVYYYNKSFDNVQFVTGDECAEFLCNSISMSFGSRRRENKTENYEVIATSDIPSVLCEVGFLSNKEEADRLNSEDGKDKIAKGIAQGVSQIFKLIEFNKNNN